VTGNISFWHESSDIRNKVSSFDIMNSAGEWINIWNSSFTNGTHKTLMFSEIIFPLNNLTLQFCHSYNLQAHPLLNKVTFKPKFNFLKNLVAKFNHTNHNISIQVRLITKSEVNIYFYSPGQILRGSNINRLSTANRENVFISTIGSSMLLTDWEITLDIETVDFSETQGIDCLEDEKSYDYCIKSKFLELGNNSMMSPLFLKDRSQWSSDLQGTSMKAIQDYYATMIRPDAVKSCPKSCSYFQVKYEQKAKRDVKIVSYAQLLLIFYANLISHELFYVGKNKHYNHLHT
jgi:hypothetical protein